MNIIKIEEVSKICGVPGEMILTFIQEEWVIPRDEDAFDDEDVARIRLIQELREEFGVNNEAIPIILNLLDQINRIHIELQKRL